MPAACSVETSAECERWVLERLDAARADLGLPSYQVQAGFIGLSPDKQLLTLADLDRVAYGLTPVSGLNASLGEAAAAGVRSEADPLPPSKEGPWEGFGSDWASTGPLVAYYLWMYDDGYKGPNLDCTSPGASGCWGHRRVILGEGISLPKPEVLGAATGQSSRGHVGTALLISSHSGASTYYTWAQAESEGAGGGGGGTGPGQITIRVQVAGNGSVAINGTPCPSTCTERVPLDVPVKLVARAASGYRFTRWSGGVCANSSKHRCMLPANEAEEAVVATFVPRPAGADALAPAALLEEEPAAEAG